MKRPLHAAVSAASSKASIAIAGLAAAMIVLSGCTGEGGAGAGSSAQSDDQVTELTVGITPIANAANLYIAIDQGYFDDEGLVVTPSVIQTAATAIPSLLNDELQLALMTSVPVITAASKGLPVVVASGNDRYPVDGVGDTTALIAAPDSGVSSVEGLADKTVAVVGLKSAPELALRVVLEEAGVDPADVEIVEIAYPDMVSALQSDRVDAAFVVDPFLSEAEAAGLVPISQPFTEGLGGMTALTWVAGEQFANANPETITKFTTAIQRAAEYANENPEAVRAVLPTFTSLSPEAIENSVIPLYDSSLSEADVENYVELMEREGFIEAGYDPSDLLWKTDGD